MRLAEIFVCLEKSVNSFAVVVVAEIDKMLKNQEAAIKAKFSNIELCY